MNVFQPFRILLQQLYGLLGFHCEVDQQIPGAFQDCLELLKLGVPP